VTALPWSTNEAADRERYPWVRPAQRPEWGRDDVQWWWRVDEGFRLPSEDERGHKCSMPNCPNECQVVRLEQVTRFDTWTSYHRRSFRCHDHVYGERILDGGRVLVRSPRLEERP
jgi:hypothetical protein